MTFIENELFDYSMAINWFGKIIFSKEFCVFLNLITLLAFTANSAAQSSAQTHIHSAIVVIDTSNNAWHSQVHWLVETPYLAVKDSNANYFDKHVFL